MSRNGQCEIKKQEFTCVVFPLQPVVPSPRCSGPTGVACGGTPSPDVGVCRAVTGTLVQERARPFGKVSAF